MTDTYSIFPLGQFIGNDQAAGGAADAHTVRIGWDLFDLSSPLHVELWLLAHGVDDHDWSTPWNRQAIIECYRDAARRRSSFVNLVNTPLEADPARIEKAFDALVQSGILVQIDPVADADRCDTFMGQHRFLPQLIGLGDMDEPGMEEIGLLDEPMLQVTTTLADTWRAASNFDDLAQLREGAAGAANARQLFSDLRVFLIHEAGYLDRSMAYADQAQERSNEQQDAPHPGKWAVPAELLSSNRLSSEAIAAGAYRSKVTGQDPAFDYVVTNPTTGEDVIFHSIASEALIYTILRKKLSISYVSVARSQVAAAAGRPIEWLVADAKSADSIRAKLQKAGITAISVVHRA